jgi:hypothetical protein
MGTPERVQAHCPKIPVVAWVLRCRFFGIDAKSSMVMYLIAINIG